MGGAFAVWLATGFGLGRRVTMAPGTVGSLLALPLAWLTSGLAPFDQVLLLVLFVAVAARLASRAERELGAHDPSSIVIDEICGMTIALACHPFDPTRVVLGFAFFRVLDIWKPWPIRLIDARVPGGMGTVADDVVAGLLANLLLIATAA